MEQMELVSRRLDLFAAGQWNDVLAECAAIAADAPRITAASAPSSEDEAADLRIGRVLQLIRAGKFRRAVHMLTSLGLATGDAETVAEPLREYFQAGLYPHPDGHDVQCILHRRHAPLLDIECVEQALRQAPSKSGAGATGSRFEVYFQTVTLPRLSIVYWTIWHPARSLGNGWVEHLSHSCLVT